MSLGLFTLVFFLISVSIVICLIEPPSNHNIVNKKILSVTKKHFIFVRFLTLTFLYDGIHQFDLSDFVTELIKNLNVSIKIKAISFVINNTDFHSEDYLEESNCSFKETKLNFDNLFKIKEFSTDSFEGFVIVIHNLQVLFKFLEQNDVSEIIPEPRATYVVVLTSTDCTTLIKEVHQDLKLFWIRYNIANLFAFSSFCNWIYVYHPFKKTEISWGTTQKYSLEETNSNSMLVTNSFRNLNGYPLRISIFNRVPTALKEVPSYMWNNPSYGSSKIDNFGGMEGTLLRELSEYLNFKPVIDESHPTHGKVLSNGTVTGTLNQIIHRKVDFSANDWFLQDYHTNQIELTVPYSSDRICPVVPKAFKVPQWKTFFLIFDLTSWVLFLFMWLCCIYVWLVFNPVRNTSSAIFEICGILFGYPLRLVPLPNQYLFLGSCMILNLIIMGIIQGSVFTDFTTKIYHKDINTLEELDNSNLKIASSISLLDDDNSEVIRRLKTKQIENYDDSLRDVACKRTIAVLGRKQDMEYLLNSRFIAEDGSPLLHISNECLQSFLLVSLFPKGSPFLVSFNHVITKLFEAGLVKKWYDDVMVVGTLIHQMKNFAKRTPSNNILSLKDVQLGFYLLFVGYVGSFIAFLTEIVRR